MRGCQCCQGSLQRTRWPSSCTGAAQTFDPQAKQNGAGPLRRLQVALASPHCPGPVLTWHFAVAAGIRSSLLALMSSHDSPKPAAAGFAWPAWHHWHADIKGFPGMCLPCKRTQYGCCYCCLTAAGMVGVCSHAHAMHWVMPCNAGDTGCKAGWDSPDHAQKGLPRSEPAAWLQTPCLPRKSGCHCS